MGGFHASSVTGLESVQQLRSAQPAAIARQPSDAAQSRAIAKARLAAKRRQQTVDGSAAMPLDVPQKKQKFAVTCPRGGIGSAKRCTHCRGFMKGEHAKYLQEKQCKFAAGQFANDGVVIGPPP